MTLAKYRQDTYPIKMVVSDPKLLNYLRCIFMNELDEVKDDHDSEYEKTISGD